MNLEQKIVINRNLSTNLGFLLCSDWSLGICYLHSLTLILEGLKIFQSFTEPFSVAKTTLHSQMSVRQSSKPLISFIIFNLSFIILHSSFLHFATFKLFSLFLDPLVEIWLAWNQEDITAVFTTKIGKKSKFFAVFAKVFWIFFLE